MKLIERMQDNPTAELWVRVDPSHPAYLRDSINREKFIDGPFERDEYQPLIDSGELVESGEFCSVFVLASAATTVFPPRESQNYECSFDDLYAERKFWGRVLSVSIVVQLVLWALCFINPGG